jgi:hypothetical protein
MSVSWVELLYLLAGLAAIALALYVVILGTVDVIMRWWKGEL